MILEPQILNTMQAKLGKDLVAFLPELILCGSIVLLLVLRLFKAFDRVHLGFLALLLTLTALAVSWAQWTQPPGKEEMFTGAGGHGLLVYDNFTIFLRMFLLGFTSLVIWLTMLTGIPDREDSADFYCLLLGATLGMSLMASANHLLMVYIAVEMASLPSYALAGFLKGRRQSSEAALKYVVYGGGASGIMLYGISLIAGKFGTGYLPDLATTYSAAFTEALRTIHTIDPILVLGTLFVLIGLAFKLAAVPFHFWCPDVFEGAAAEVAAFLSVASKGAALALLARLVLVLGTPPGGPVLPAVGPVVTYLVPILALLAAVTATFGNLAAYAQTNLKRLLAYSTIAHAGYMIMGLATLQPEGAAAMLTYLIAYLFMNLGAFAVVAFLRNQTGSEDLSAFRGLIYRSPVMVITLAVFLLSLLGIPPLVGFFAKFQIFAALFDAAKGYGMGTGLGITMLALLAIGGLNTVISLVYYIKVLKVMILDKPLEEVEGQPARPLKVPFAWSAYATVLALVVLVVGVFWNPLVSASYNQGVKQLAELGKGVMPFQGARPGEAAPPGPRRQGAPGRGRR